MDAPIGMQDPSDGFDKGDIGDTGDIGDVGVEGTADIVAAVIHRGSFRPRKAFTR